ncbi:emp24/gp25L/p24 family/GOLD-domain-containing protein [Chytriomyces sp. MP71]|nr:emp24/gp25L/p24 family/GOLD-domain-containing protein [Chytriomyces sp. MP71]
MARLHCCVVLALTVVLALCADALKFELPSAPPGGVRRCVKQYILADTLVVGHYEVGPDNNGGQRVDVEIFDDAPVASKYYHKNSVGDSSQKFTFNTHETANIHYCFTNTNTNQGYHESAGHKRTIALHVDTGAEAEDYSETKKNLEPMEQELYRLERISKQLTEEMDMLKADEEKMRDVNESTNSRVALLSTLSIIVLVGAAGWQLYYLRSFFRSKKIL